MAEKDRNKAGLHKKISSIFSGVVIPQANKWRKSSGNSDKEDNDYNEPEVQVPESQESEPSIYDQPAITLPEDESSTEYNTDSANQSNSVAAQDSEVVPVEQSAVDYVPQTDEESVESQGLASAQDSEDIPVEHSAVDSAKKPDEKSIESQESAAVQDSEDIPVEQSTEKPASPPKFLTAQDTKSVLIEESDIDTGQQTGEKSDKPSEFVTATGAKVIPISESDVDPIEQLEVESMQQSKAEATHKSDLETSNQDKTAETKKPKFIPVKWTKGDNSKGAKKQTKVKVREQNFWNQITAKLFTPKPGVSPTKQKVMVVMIPVLFIFLLIFVFKGGVFGTSVNNVHTGENNSTSGAASAALSTQIEWKVPEPYPAATLRDPMRLGPVKRENDQTGSGRPAKLKVKGILFSEDGSSSAIIGNRIVHEGEQIRGVNIKKINKKNVEFEANGETWTQEVQ